MEANKTGQLIKTRRLEKGLTQEDLAKRLNVTNRAVSKWERGINAPDISLLEPLARALDITTAELLTGDLIQNPVSESVKLEIAQRESIVYGVVRELDSLKRQQRRHLVRCFVVIFLIGCLFGAYKLWAWWPHEFEPLDGGFRIEYHPADPDAGGVQSYTFAAGSPEAEAIRESISKYTYHLKAASLIYNAAVHDKYYSYSFSYDGDIVVVYALDDESWSSVFTFAVNSKWCFIDGDLVFFSGLRGDQTCAMLINDLKDIAGVET